MCANAQSLLRAVSNMQDQIARYKEAQGLLTCIECGAKGLIFHIKVNGRALKLQSESFESIQSRPSLRSQEMR